MQKNMEVVWPFEVVRKGQLSIDGRFWMRETVERLCRAGTPERWEPKEYTFRHRLMQVALLAEQSGRHLDILNAFEQLQKLQEAICHEGLILNREERDLMSIGWKSLLDKCRTAYYRASLADAAQKQLAADVLNEYKILIGADIRNLYDRASRLLSTLIRTANMYSRKEDVAFYERMLADYARYVAETDTCNIRAMTEISMQAYARAAIAALALDAAHPVRLSVWLNYSVFIYSLTNDPLEAKRVTAEALSSALTSLGNGSGDNCTVTALVSQMQSNLKYWSSLATNTSSDVSSTVRSG
jgi:hypothetical protein